LAYCKSVSEQNNESRISVLTALSENTPKSSSFNVQNFDQLESPFEEEVYQSLLDEFGEEKLIPQLQFAGFRIDIVFDSKKTNVPKIAIECDGAKYHSSQEAYLYDRHRQKILERHGFVFHRIWSTNWWRNPKRELTKLIEFIKKIETEVTSNHKDYSATSLAFTDDFQSISTYCEKIKLPVVVLQVTIGAVTPPPEVLEETRRTAAQNQSILTQEARAKSESARKQAEINKAIADKAYQTQMNMSTTDYLHLRALEIEKEKIELVREKQNVSIIMGQGIVPTFGITK
jgi:very-short-patch-repair endonuclease